MSLSKRQYNLKELRVSIERLASPRMEVPESVQKVFGIPELREEIISQAVYKRENDKPVVCRQTVQALRLVSKGCLSSVTKVLEKDKEALCQLVLDRSNSISESPLVNQQNGKLLDKFVNQMTTAEWNLKDPPTFSLNLMPDFFRTENYDSLRTCLVQCGKALVKLELFAPEDGGSLPSVLPPYTLPALQEVTVNFTRLLTLKDPGETTNVANITHLLQSLLLASSAVINFKVSFLSATNPVPQHFELLTLPVSITKLKLHYGLTASDFKILVRNPLPNLKHLSVTISMTALSHGLVFQALENYSRTLEHLTLNGTKLIDRDATLIRFPVMEKLVYLGLKGINLQLEPGITFQAMASTFPKLKRLNLHQNETGFSRWTETFTFPEVKRVKLQLVENGHPDPLIHQRLMSLGLEKMQLVHRGFPNVRCLTLSMSTWETSGLEYIFLEMRELLELHLNVKVWLFTSNADFWDALLTGTTVELMAALRSCPDLWETTSFGNHNRPSILMLTKLVSLSLADFRFNRRLNVGRNDDHIPLISDLAFTHGFLKMPKLVKLTLMGRFRASQEMSFKWKAGNRKISDTREDGDHSPVIIE